MRLHLLALVAALLAAVAPSVHAVTRAAAEDPAPAEKRADYDHLNLDKDGLALAGYDPVAYFSEGGGKPQKGKAELARKHRGVTYRFASKEHLALFDKDPGKYEPAYGGWCAYAMAKGEKVEVDPESFVIQGGKLMVFYDSFFNDTRKKWLKKPTDYQEDADAKWAKLVTPEPKPEPEPKPAPK